MRLTLATCYCPMGCGRTLLLDGDGHLFCSWYECPNPSAADEILSDRETQHLVILTDSGFTVRHPLRERLGDALMRCDLHAELLDAAGPPHRPGVYRVSDRPRRWEQVR